jgi:hypothetical protein
MPKHMRLKGATECDDEKSKKIEVSENNEANKLVKTETVVIVKKSKSFRTLSENHAMQESKR